MADDKQFFPGFEGDDEPKAPAKPAPAKKPAFSAFDGPVKVPSPADPPPPPAAQAAAKPPPPAPPPADGDDPDLKPGSRKDLWKCPHCGAGNKPDRTTCRSCGKSPGDPVVVAWYQNNLIRAGILAAIGAVVVVAVMLGRTDLALREPALANVDRKPRITGTATGSAELGGGITFTGEHLISVCGRVAGVGRGPGGTTVIALALGPAAAAEHPEATANADGGFTCPGGVVLACSSDTPLAVKAGQIVSLNGATGSLIRDAALVKEAEGMIAVRIDTLKIAQ